MAGPGPLLVVGEALVDVVLAADGTRSEHPGGSPVNVAVTASRLGVPCTLLTQLGDDEHGELIRAHVEASGVRVHTAAPPGPTGRATARIGPDGAADYEFDITWDPVRLPLLPGMAGVHAGSIGLALAPGGEQVLELLAAAYAAGVPVSVDPNVRTALTPDLEAIRSTATRAFGFSWAVKLSDEDAAVVAPGRDSHEVLDEVLGCGPAMAVLTRGSAPMLLASPTARVEVRPPTTQVADTIGAGDTVMGALLATAAEEGWLGARELGTAELHRLGRVAVAAAAITCSRPGADPPWREELSPALK